MTREEALEKATAIYEQILLSGNEEIFEAARGADGKIDQIKLVKATVRATSALADELMREEKDYVKFNRYALGVLEEWQQKNDRSRVRNTAIENTAIKFLHHLLDGSDADEKTISGGWDDRS